MRFRQTIFFQLFALFVAINSPPIFSAEPNLTLNDLVQEKFRLRSIIEVLKMALQANFSLQGTASLAGPSALFVGHLEPRVQFFWKYYYCFEQLKTMLPSAPWCGNFRDLASNVELLRFVISSKYSILQLQAEQKAWQLILDVIRQAKKAAFPAFRSLGDVPWTEQQLIVFIKSLLERKCFLSTTFTEEVRFSLFSDELCFWQTTFDKEALGLATLFSRSLFVWFEQKNKHFC